MKEVNKLKATIKLMDELKREEIKFMRHELTEKYEELIKGDGATNKLKAFITVLTVMKEFQESFGVQQLTLTELKMLTLAEVEKHLSKVLIMHEENWVPIISINKYCFVSIDGSGNEKLTNVHEAKLALKSDVNC